jgi:hypothetical protein
VHIKTKNVELELDRWGVVVFLGLNLGKMRLETFKGVGEPRTWDWFEPVSAIDHRLKTPPQPLEEREWEWDDEDDERLQPPQEQEWDLDDDDDEVPQPQPLEEW